MVAMSVVELTGDNFMKSRTVVFFSVFIDCGDSTGFDAIDDFKMF